MSPLQEESGCDEDEGEEEEGREEEDEFDSDESLVDSDSDSDEKGENLTAATTHRDLTSFPFLFCLLTARPHLFASLSVTTPFEPFKRNMRQDASKNQTNIQIHNT